jgi:hypothetical protein
MTVNRIESVIFKCNENLVKIDRNTMNGEKNEEMLKMQVNSCRAWWEHVLRDFKREPQIFSGHGSQGQIGTGLRGIGHC